MKIWHCRTPLACRPGFEARSGAWGRRGPLLNDLAVAAVLAFAHGLAAAAGPSIEGEGPSQEGKRFALVPPESSGIAFSNRITETLELNHFNFPHLYMGAGVAIGDLDNDGLPDVFFASSLERSALYRNLGDLRFEEIAESAGIDTSGGICVGVALADVNADGLLDIYISRTGPWEDGDRLRNLLYINNGDMTFAERAREYGVAGESHSVQASFFDYDRDGDLDLYVVNTPEEKRYYNYVDDIDAIYQSDLGERLRGADKLYRNDEERGFVDVSSAAGLKSDIGYGLNVSVGDLNGDGWPDIYVTNDFSMPDLLYMNNGDGTFEETAASSFKRIPWYSMGSDLQDLNGDGLLDIVALDMATEDYVRSKTTMGMVDTSLYKRMVESGFHRQYMHNMLYLNRGPVLPGKVSLFSEISRYAGIDKTDWSWSPIVSDLDNDGDLDLWVTNGIYREISNKDAYKRMHDYIDSLGGVDALTLEQLRKARSFLPQQPIPNYVFSNEGDLRFEKRIAEWGMDLPSMSQGSAVGDLDLDGDLDLVCSNMLQPSFLFENRSEKDGRRWLRVKLDGPKGNPFGYGTVVYLKGEDGVSQTRQQMPARGYLSSSEPILHFGLGRAESVAELRVVWPDGRSQVLENAKANQIVSADYRDAAPGVDRPTLEEGPAPLFAAAGEALDPPFYHQENQFDDYAAQALLPHRFSRLGPFLSKGDVNGDGLEDFYVGGAAFQPGALYLQDESGSFARQSIDAFAIDESHEDQGSCFFDADGDGDLDLYAASGGYEFEEGSLEYQDRLYLNDGKGSFRRAMDRLPDLRDSGSLVLPADIDGDGDIDLFVGGRQTPGRYPYPATSRLLLNDGKGNFADATRERAPAFFELGMAAAAVFFDYDGDGDPDLAVGGDWMPIRVFENEKGAFAPAGDLAGFSDTEGWWSSLRAIDLDRDGDLDLVAGNLGENYKFHATADKPMHVFSEDFDGNSTVDVFLAKPYDDSLVPVRGLQCSTTQMPSIAERFETFEQFARAGLADVIGQNFERARHYTAKEFSSCFFENLGDGRFRKRALPWQAQLSPVNGIVSAEINGDGLPDLILVGNLFNSEVETTPADASEGLVMLSKGAFEYDCRIGTEIGFFAGRDAKHAISVEGGGGRYALVGNNDGPLQIFSFKEPAAPAVAKRGP